MRAVKTVTPFGRRGWAAHRRPIRLIVPDVGAARAVAEAKPHVVAGAELPGAVDGDAVSLHERIALLQGTFGRENPQPVGEGISPARLDLDAARDHPVKAAAKLIDVL